MTDIIARGMAANANARIDNLPGDHFLGLWNCATGKPTVDPSSLPYTYKAGDYYKVGTVASGTATHTIHIAGTTGSTGTYTGTYTVDFTITNHSGAQFTSISALAEYISTNFVNATGTLHTSEGDMEIAFVTQWLESGEYVIALCNSSNEKLALTQTTADTFTDTVSGSGVNYKPSGSTYTGAASTSVVTGTVVTGMEYYYDGSDWQAAKADGAPVFTLDPTTGILSVTWG